MRYNRDWNKASFLEVFLHGIVMGSINKLPGISGGLYSLIIGFYNHLIQSIKSINYKNLTVLKKSGLKQFMKNINGYFLLFISFGMIMSYFSTSKILDYFLIQNELYVWSVFFGLIIGSVYILVKRLRTTDLKKLSYLFFGFLFGIFISFSEPLYENRNLLFVFFCGFISICGITIPGLSGSFLLILLGNYKLLLVDSVNNFYNLILNLFNPGNKLLVEYEMINILIVFFIGSVLGLIILSKFLTYITKKFPNQLDHLIIGFVLGTLYIVWPWNQIKNNMDQTEMTSSINSVAFILILIGLILTIIINNYVDKKNIRLNR
tara:strand:- start:19615 stop:20574 length:960 start_codon:yes stop_codon:yes gene_type:complete